MAKPYYNPAVAGATEDLNILALARLEMIGVHGAPKSFFITADMPLALGKTNHGVGLVVFTEAIGLFQNTHVGAQYAYKYKLFGGVLSGGLQIGLVLRRVWHDAYHPTGASTGRERLYLYRSFT